MTGIDGASHVAESVDLPFRDAKANVPRGL